MDLVTIIAIIIGLLFAALLFFFEEAFEKMQKNKYGLVISDWNMEPMTGYELLQKVRADEGLKSTPFIMVTAESKTEYVVAAKKAGVNNYIVKPFNAETLKGKIESVLGPID